VGIGAKRQPPARFADCFRNRPTVIGYVEEVETVNIVLFKLFSYKHTILLDY